MSAVRAPLRSSTVLMATVVPCRTSASAGIRQSARFRLSATPRVGSAGTVDVFAVTMRPSMQPTRSVKVPPISTPTMFKVRLRRLESDGDEFVGVELVALGHPVEDAELVERMTDHVDRRHVPRAVIREARDLAVVDLGHDARLDLDGLAGRLHGAILVGPDEANALEPAAQEAPQHLAALIDHVVGGKDDVRIEMLGDGAEQEQVARLARLLELVAVGGFLHGAVELAAIHGGEARLHLA